MSTQDTLLAKIMRAAVSLIPGKGFADTGYYHTSVKRRAAKLLNSDPNTEFESLQDFMEDDFRNKIDSLDSLTKKEIEELALDLGISFGADRRFRKGWVVDGYWKAYEKCSATYQTTLDGIVGL